MQCGDVEKLIKFRKDPDESPLYYVSIEDTFDIIQRAHIATGHGGRDRMHKEITRKYANITIWTLGIFKSFCLECQKKKKKPKATGIVVRPILSEDFLSRGQVDLIDMQSMPANGHKWIMVYQDHLTKFCVLRALSSKRAAGVAIELLDIFLLFGAPAILQSDNGYEFTAEVIKELAVMWPGMKLVRGQPRYPQSQGSVERANGDIKDMLTAWLADNTIADWTMGIHFVQFQKNIALHAGIKRAPYEALFGGKPKVGLTSSTLPQEVINKLQTEEDLQRLFQEPPGDQLSPDTSSSIITSPSTQSNSSNSDLGMSPLSSPVAFEGSSPSSDSASPSIVHPVLSHVSDPDSPLDPIQPSGQLSPLIAPSSPPPVPISSNINDLEPDSPLSINERKIKEHHKRARHCQSKQADRMIKRRKILLPSVKIGDTVTIPIPDSDRGRGDPRNMIGMVMDYEPTYDKYTIGTKAGILTVSLSGNQFNVCENVFLYEEDINKDREISLRQAVKANSPHGGQGFKKCNCSKNGCRTNICKCFKANIKCNSRCHSNSSLTCTNK